VDAGGGTGRTRLAPRRLGPSVVVCQISQAKNRTMRARRAMGMSAMSAPQSGTTNRARKSRIAFQI